MAEMQKLVKDGKVAVLYSPGFGAGWSTWNSDNPEVLFDPEIAQAVLDSNHVLAAEIAERKYPNCCVLGADDLVVEWLPVGTEFFIKEYDGSESLRLKEELKFETA